MKGGTKGTLLIVDDDQFFCRSVLAFFSAHPFAVAAAHSSKSALQWCADHRADVILLDQKLPDGEGLNLCNHLLERCDQAKIIFITAYPSFDHAVQALRHGADDYLSKPLELEELQLAVERAFRTIELERVAQLQQLHIRRDSAQNRLIGARGGLSEVQRLIELAAASRAPVLLTGETGTGKNVVAKAIHYFGERHAPAFIDLNCAALPENLIESELFGHERGAFTGAVTARKGLFEMADGGTLFLDEIGEIPSHLQAKLLGILDHGLLRRIGGETTRTVDVRIIAATNVELEKAVEAGTFRRDLYYRLSVMRIHLPPLRQRRQDIGEFCRAFLETIAPEQGLILPAEELARLESYPWPGNVRELRNILERAVILRQDKTIHPSSLLEPSGSSNRLTNYAAQHEAAAPLPTLADLERRHIALALARCGGNHTQTAAALGIARSTLLRKLQ
jgi:DNA-binding NtrC family response regulator